MELAFYIDEVPEDMMWPIVEKLLPKTYTKIHRVCKSIHHLLSERKNLIPVNISSIVSTREGTELYPPAIRSPVPRYPENEETLKCFKIVSERFFIERDIDDTVYNELLAMAEELKLTTNMITFTNPIQISCAKLKHFITVIRASSITVSRSIEKATFPPATFENIKRRLTLSESNYGNSELLQLKQPVLDIHCADVDSHGLHSFIMEWCNNNRLVEFVSIISMKDFDFEIITQGLNVSLLYDAASHEHSLLGFIELARFSTSNNGIFIYVLWKTDNVSDQYILDITPHTAIFYQSDPVKYLFDRFSYRTPNQIAGVCLNCRQPIDDCTCIFE